MRHVQLALNWVSLSEHLKKGKEHEEREKW